MKKFDIVISALVGGLVGAAVVFFATGNKFDKLEVRDLTVTGDAILKSAENKQQEVVIKNGSIVVTNVIAATRIVGTQVQGHVFVANRMLTSPDNLIRNENKQWKFYTEIGSSAEKGGELIVRSLGGPISGAQLDNMPTNGWMFRAGYMDMERPDIAFVSNATKEVMPVAILRRSTIEPATGNSKTATNAAPNPTINPNPTIATLPNTTQNITPTPGIAPTTQPTINPAANPVNPNVNNYNNQRSNNIIQSTPNVAGANPLDKK
jgi:hypothetical protein